MKNIFAEYPRQGRGRCGLYGVSVTDKGSIYFPKKYADEFLGGKTKFTLYYDAAQTTIAIKPEPDENLTAFKFSNWKSERMGSRYAPMKAFFKYFKITLKYPRIELKPKWDKDHKMVLLKLP